MYHRTFSIQISKGKQIKSLSKLFMRQTLNRISVIISLLFGMVLAIIMSSVNEKMLVPSIDQMQIQQSQIDNQPQYFGYNESSQYYLQYDQQQTSETDIKTLTDRYYNYQVISNNRNSTDIEQMNNFLLQQPNLIGVAIDNINQTTFGGKIVIGMVSQLYIPLLLGLCNTNLGFILTAMPLLTIASQDTIDTCQYMTSLSIQFLFLLMYQLYDQYAKNRIENRTTIIQLQGVSKLTYHFVQNLHVFIVYYVQYLILFITILICQSKWLKGISILIFIVGGAINCLMIVLYGDLISHIGKSFQVFQTSFILLSMCITILPTAVLSTVLYDIPGELMSILLSCIPSFGIANYIGACYKLTVQKQIYSFSSISFKDNAIILQLIFQIIYCVLLGFFAILADRSIINYPKNENSQCQKDCEKKQEQQQKVKLIQDEQEIPQNIKGQSDWFQVKQEQYKAKNAYKQYKLNLTQDDNIEEIPLTISSYADSTSSNTANINEKQFIVNDVCKTFVNKQHAIYANNHISFTVQKGTLMFILGPNGSGKSTLCKNVIQQNKLNKGDIILNNISIKQNQLYRNKISVCMQSDEGLIDCFTVQEHLQFYKDLTLEDNQSEHFIQDLITQFQLQQYSSSKPQQLSGGYKRRLSLVCALIKNPELLFLDEVTTGVDIVSQKQLWELINQIKQNKIIIATTHTLKEAQEYADKIGFIINGQIRCIGTVKELESIVENQTIFKVNGILNQQILDEINKQEIKVINNIDLDLHLRINDIIVNNQDRLKLFQLLQQLQSIGKIQSFSISNQMIEQIFFDLCQKE